MKILLACTIVALSMCLVMSKPKRARPFAVDKFVDPEVSLHADASLIKRSRVASYL